MEDIILKALTTGKDRNDALMDRLAEAFQIHFKKSIKEVRALQIEHRVYEGSNIEEFWYQDEPFLAWERGEPEFKTVGDNVEVQITDKFYVL